MKIFESNFDLNSLNKLYSLRILKILKEITQKNKDAIILTPFTKFNELFNFKKDNLLSEIIATNIEDYQIKIIDQSFVISLISKINQFLQFELLDYKLEYDKIIKTIFEISNQFIDENTLPIVLNLLNRFAPKRLEVVITGFAAHHLPRYENLDLLYLISSLKNQNINFNNLQTLWIDNQVNNYIFVVEDQYKFLSWLELQAKTVISCKQLNDYFDGIINYQSFLIENCLQKISEITL